MVGGEVVAVGGAEIPLQLDGVAGGEGYRALPFWETASRNLSVPNSPISALVT